VVSFALYVPTRRPSLAGDRDYVRHRVTDEYHAEPAVADPADQVQDTAGLPRRLHPITTIRRRLKGYRSAVARNGLRRRAVLPVHLIPRGSGDLPPA
jgi:hypothetical protein